MIPALVGAQDSCAPARHDLNCEALNIISATFASD
jgi:hypothetical protein